VIYGVIMAGGRGERFWPLSRGDRPKQFLKLTSDQTMLEETIERVRPMIPLEKIRIVTGESMADTINQQCRLATPDMLLTEPLGRNTSLAIGLAAVHLQHVDPAAIMVVLSADHLVRPSEKLLSLLKDGCQIAAQDDVLITVGIMPTRPETGYGYIKIGDPYEFPADSKTYHVAAFAEKPKAVVAQEYYYSRKYLWNAGMFVWSTKAILGALKTHREDLYELLDSYAKHIGKKDELKARHELYNQSPSISIDYAVLEKAQNVLTLKADIIWDDVGSWNSLERYKDRDSEKNVVIGRAFLHDSFETTIYNDVEDEFIACLGLSDLVIVKSDNITFVAHKTKLGQIKELLARLGENEETKKYL
jgi:mannose-1-phosphate guanylyltransferase